MATIPCMDDIELTEYEKDFVFHLSSILSSNDKYSSLIIEQRSQAYLSVVYMENDFFRFKYSPNAKWVSIRLPRQIAKQNWDNPIFSSQKNKNQLHWKVKISSIDDLYLLSDFIHSSCKDW